MKNNRTVIRWGIFIIVAICSYFTLFFIQQRYLSIQESGWKVQWPVKVYREQEWIPSDYLKVAFVPTKAHWDDKIFPKVGDTVYVKIGLQTNGMAYVKGANKEVPVRDKYIKATVKAISDYNIEFEIPDNRLRINVAMVNDAFYKGDYKGILIGDLRIKDGDIIVDGVYSKGQTILTATPSKVKESKNASELLEPEFKKGDISIDDSELENKKSMGQI